MLPDFRYCSELIEDKQRFCYYVAPLSFSLLDAISLARGSIACYHRCRMQNNHSVDYSTLGLLARIYATYMQRHHYELSDMTFVIVFGTRTPHTCGILASFPSYPDIRPFTLDNYPRFHKLNVLTTSLLCFSFLFHPTRSCNTAHLD
ncbi:uncharacterized protein ARMOST_15767 [Armillaria ostoyae]|uniref:Uncharacterized protein n=1 Tax=Armillaria ostoyae TaxID=47428 RepID=A0A284RUD0_ARMOS|nr:uncharacterized protein ARMOST_15767 [Armillaria ostoyae]